MGWTNMRRCLIIILICILLLAAINEVLFKSVSSNDFVVDSGDTENLPISTPSEPEKTPLSENVNNKNGYSTGNHQILENYPKYDKFPHTKTDPIVHPIVPNISEIDEYFIEDQEMMDNNSESDIYIFNPTKTEEENLLQNLNEIDGYFTENQGQVGNNSVRYYIQGKDVWFLDDGVMFEIREEISINSQQSTVYGHESEFPFNPRVRLEPQEQPKYKSVVLKLNFEGANLVVPKGVGLLPHRSNFFYGNISLDWHTNVPNFQEIIYENIYENINLKYYITARGLKYDFIVHPNGNPGDIRLIYEGVEELRITSSGNLVIQTELGDIADSDLFIYQDYGGICHKIEGTFEIYNNTEYGFNINDIYNQQEVLIIDPSLIYSTFIGGNNADYGCDIAIDPKGNLFVGGHTTSSNFPATPNASDTSYNGGGDLFVFKLNPNGSKLIYSTFIGGSNSDWGGTIALDSTGNTFVTGRTLSSNFPTTKGAYDTTHNGSGDVFIFKLNQNGSGLLYSTFVGGSYYEVGYDIAIDGKGNAIVVGTTSSSGFPTTLRAYDRTFNDNNYFYYDGFAFKINSIGSTLLYSTFIGGTYIYRRK